MTLTSVGRRQKEDGTWDRGTCNSDYEGNYDTKCKPITQTTNDANEVYVCTDRDSCSYGECYRDNMTLGCQASNFCSGSIIFGSDPFQNASILELTVFHGQRLRECQVRCFETSSCEWFVFKMDQNIIEDVVGDCAIIPGKTMETMISYPHCAITVVEQLKCGNDQWCLGEPNNLYFLHPKICPSDPKWLISPCDWLSDPEKPLEQQPGIVDCIDNPQFVSVDGEKCYQIEANQCHDGMIAANCTTLCQVNGGWCGVTDVTTDGYLLPFIVAGTSVLLFGGLVIAITLLVRRRNKRLAGAAKPTIIACIKITDYDDRLLLLE